MQSLTTTEPYSQLQRAPGYTLPLSYMGNTAASRVAADDGSLVAKLNSSKRSTLSPCPTGTTTTWPCANCHSIVSSQDSCCPVCRGRQVKLEPTDCPSSLWLLERVSSPHTTNSNTPVNLVSGIGAVIKPPPLSNHLLHHPMPASLDDPTKVSPSTQQPHALVSESNDQRPVDPVALTLASVPSPVPPTSTSALVSLLGSTNAAIMEAVEFSSPEEDWEHSTGQSELSLSTSVDVKRKMTDDSKDVFLTEEPAEFSDNDAIDDGEGDDGIDDLDESDELDLSATDVLSTPKKRKAMH